MRREDDNRDEVERILKQNRININAYDDEGYALIHWAAKMGRGPYVELLCKYGASLELLTLVFFRDLTLMYRMGEQLLISLDRKWRNVNLRSRRRSFTVFLNGLTLCTIPRRYILFSIL